MYKIEIFINRKHSHLFPEFEDPLSVGALRLIPDADKILRVPHQLFSVNHKLSRPSSSIHLELKENGN